MISIAFYFLQRENKYSFLFLYFSISDFKFSISAWDLYGYVNMGDINKLQVANFICFLPCGV